MYRAGSSQEFEKNYSELKEKLSFNDENNKILRDLEKFYRYSCKYCIAKIPKAFVGLGCSSATA
jgi:hypothetical protein